MAEKWDDSATDSPEVVYEGFSPPPTHPQGMINAASSSFVSADGNDDGSLGGQPGGYMSAGPLVEEQHPVHGEGSHHEEIERTRLCFVCCNPVSDKNFESIKASMNHSHAPLLVLLTDVLGYKLEEGRLHSQVVCKACYHLLDIIDELQQTLTESKTDVRTKFLETVQKLKLKYPRTDKMLKPRCLRCIQMSQTSARKRGRGRAWKGRAEDISRGRGRGRGRGRARSRSEDGHDPGSDNDNEGQGYCSGEIRKDVLPSKSQPPQTCQDNSKPDCSTLLGLSGVQTKSSLTSDHCLWDDKSSRSEHWDALSTKHVTDGHTFYPADKQTDNESVLEESLHNWINHSDVDLINAKVEYANKECEDCVNMNYYECFLCKKGGSKIFYQYCESCLMCQGTFIPWGNSVNLEFIGDQCSILKVQAKSQIFEEKLCIVTYGSVLLDGESEIESMFDRLPRLDIEKGSGSKVLTEDLFSYAPITGCEVETQEDVTLSLQCLRNNSLTEYDHLSVKEKLHNIDSKKDTHEGSRDVKGLFNGNLNEESIIVPEDGNDRFFVQDRIYTETNSTTGDIEGRVHENNSSIICVPKDNSPSDLLMSRESPNVVVGENSCEEAIESVTCIMQEVDDSSDVDHSYIVVSETLDVHSESDGTVHKNGNFKHESSKEENGAKLPCNDRIPIEGIKIKQEDKNSEVKQNASSSVGNEGQDHFPEGKIISELENKALSDVFTDISSQPSLGKRRRKPTAKAKEFLIDDELSSIKTEKKIKTFPSNATTTELVEDNGLTGLTKKGKTKDCLYICEFCGKKFNSIGGFRYHVNGHETSVAKVFACNLCSYKTRRKADLRKHTVIHTGEKQYKCEVCGQEFSVNSSYTRHMRIHSGEKPYKCSTCGKDFRSGGTLKQHMVKHTGARNFVCEVCGSSFSLRHHYTAHWKLHSGDLPFKCQVCTAAFRNYNALKHHRKKNHPQEEAQRLKNLKMKMIQVDEIKMQQRPKVIEESVDVLEQAMAAAVDSITCECVDSYTQTLPETVVASDSSIVSEMITDNLASKESVVLAITNLQEEVIPKDGVLSKSPTYTQQTASEELEEQTHATIVHSVEVDDSPTTRLVEGEGQDSVHHAIESSLQSSFYTDNGVANAADFIVVNSEGEPMPNLKPENVKVVHANNDETSPMYIVLSDMQAPDSQLYIVLDKDTHV